MNTTKFKKHIFICCNDKPDGKKCCGEEFGKQLQSDLKSLIKEKQLQNEIRVSKSGCLGVCAYGPNMVIYPEQVWYGGLKKDEIPRIFEDHILKNTPIKNWQIDFEEIASKYLKKRETAK